MSGRLDDPESQAARVFVGGVNPDTEEQVLIERFSKHGNVKGINCMNLLARVYRSRILERMIYNQYS